MFLSWAVADAELELEDVFNPSGQLSLGFSEIKQPCQRTMISANLELHPKEIVLELMQEGNHS